MGFFFREMFFIISSRRRLKFILVSRNRIISFGSVLRNLQKIYFLQNTDKRPMISNYFSPAFGVVRCRVNRKIFPSLRLTTCAHVHDWIMAVASIRRRAIRNVLFYWILTAKTRVNNALRLTQKDHGRRRRDQEPPNVLTLKQLSPRSLMILQKTCV